MRARTTSSTAASGCVRNCSGVILDLSITVDAATLQAADRAYVEARGSFRASPVSLLGSESLPMRLQVDPGAR